RYTSNGHCDQQVVIGIDEKLKIGWHLLEREVAHVRVLLQPVEVCASPGFKGYDRVESRFHTGHPHDFQQRSLVKLVVEPVLVNKEKIGNKREIKLIVAERQLRQTAPHVARSLPRPVIVQKSAIGPFAKSAQQLGRPVENPTVSLEVPDDLSHLLQIRFAASPDL